MFLLGAYLVPLVCFVAVVCLNRLGAHPSRVRTRGGVHARALREGQGTWPRSPGSVHSGMVRVDLRIQVIEIPTQDYSLSHAFGAAFDNPSLIAASIVGDGEAETGPLAAWLFNKFLDPMSDSAVLGSS
jgi:XFP N-terminal domain